jgi:hypothetical protein
VSLRCSSQTGSTRSLTLNVLDIIHIVPFDNTASIALAYLKDIALRILQVGLNIFVVYRYSGDHYVSFALVYGRSLFQRIGHCVERSTTKHGHEASRSMDRVYHTNCVRMRILYLLLRYFLRLPLCVRERCSSIH